MKREQDLVITLSNCESEPIRIPGAIQQADPPRQRDTSQKQLTQEPLMIFLAYLESPTVMSLKRFRHGVANSSKHSIAAAQLS